MFCRAEGALTFECQRRTLGTLIFCCSRVDKIFADFGIFWNIWIFPDRKQVRPHRFGCCHWLCGCPVDSFEDFDSHWWRGKCLNRLKLKIARVDRLENPKWPNPVPDWDFGQISVHFLNFLNIAALVAATTSARFQMVFGCVRKAFGVVLSA